MNVCILWTRGSQMGVHCHVSRGTLQPELKCLNCRRDALTPYCGDLCFGLQSNLWTKSHSDCGVDVFLVFKRGFG